VNVYTRLSFIWIIFKAQTHTVGTRQPTLVLVRLWPVYGLLITIGGVGYISGDFSQTVHLYGEGNLDNSLRTSPEDGKHTINNRKNPYPVYRYYTE